jgi:DnaJ-class molecular chaperone
MYQPNETYPKRVLDAVYGPKRPRPRHPNECSDCAGLGQTTATATEFRRGETVRLGSGCPKCHGVGRCTPISIPSSR